MSLSKNTEEDIFAANHVLKGFLRPDDPMAIFAEEIYPQISDKKFEDYYSSLIRYWK